MLSHNALALLTAGLLLTAQAQGAISDSLPAAGVAAAATTVNTPDGWHSFSVREEIAPRFWTERRGSEVALGLAGRGSEAVDGRWRREVPVTAGKSYAFTAEYAARNVPQPARSILARVLWFSASGKQVEQAEYPMPRLAAGREGRHVLAGTYQAPAGAARARLELHLRWAPRGQVLWHGVALTESAPPAPRKVRLAAVNHRPAGGRMPAENLAQFAPLVEEAGRRGADILCLGEGITVAGAGKTYAEVSEPVPGPSTRILGEMAARHHLYLVAGIYEREGAVLYNTAVLLGRDGRLVGKYRKLCLPREESDGGITPGKEYPVFETDFGRVGILICWDLSYPDVARELAARGAEVLLMPIWGGNEALARARAIENQVFLVASGYDFRTAIYDRAGQPLAEAGKDPEVLVAEVDLAVPHRWPWLGDWRSRIQREAPAKPEGAGK